MKSIFLNNKIIRLYDSIDEMPIVNFQKYNKCLLIDSGIGSDADAIDAHIIKIARFINANDKKKAIQELQNMRQCMHMINNKISPRYLAFAALIHSIDDNKVSDLSDDGLKELLNSIKEIKHSTILDFLAWLKKKLAAELEEYFPDEFIGAKEKDAYDKLKKRTLLELDTLINGTNNAEQLSLIDMAILNLYSPKIFSGSSSIEIRYDKQFESTCLLIAQKANTNARKMTVLQYYVALDNIKKQAEAEAKSWKQIKR